MITGGSISCPAHHIDVEQVRYLVALIDWYSRRVLVGADADLTPEPTFD